MMAKEFVPLAGPLHFIDDQRRQCGALSCSLRSAQLWLLTGPRRRSDSLAVAALRLDSTTTIAKKKEAENDNNI